MPIEWLNLRADSYNYNVTHFVSRGIDDSCEQAMLSAAMKGELGPLAQAVAKYQLERKLQKELARLKVTEELAKAVGTEQSDEKKVRLDNCSPLCFMVTLVRRNYKRQ